MLCLQVVRSQQLKAGATKEKDRESRRREDAAEREKREQERQLYKDKLQAWKVEAQGYICTLALHTKCYHPHTL